MKRNSASSLRIRVPAALFILLLVFAGTLWGKSAQQILKESGVKGGLIVHIGCGDGKLTAALGKNDDYLVHGLDSDPAKVTRARRYIRKKGLYGRVSVMRWSGTRLPYAQNLVNLLVADEHLPVSMAEVMRVLCPRGVAYIKSGGKWTKTVKPWPEDIDEWTHYLHGPDGNPVAQDRIVGPPKHYQWISEPLWLRSHESDSSVRALVTARGRLFYIADEAPTSLLGDHSLPDKWFLMARDAFNGMLLWKVPIKDWGWRAWKPSWFTPRPGDIPLNIQKRLVANGDRVYVTLGYRAPVSELDAQTGKVLKTYDETARTAEILYNSGLLVLTVLQKDHAKVAVIDTKSAKKLWISEQSYGGTKTDYYRFRAMHGSVPPAKVDPTLNTAADGNVVALLDNPDVVALDFKTGKEKWRTNFPLVKADYKAGGINARNTLWRGTLIVRDGVVIHASPNQLAAFSADSGKLLWKQPKKYLQHLWFEWMDVFVIDGLVWTWSAELDRGKLVGGGNSTWPVSVNGYDLHTGRLTKKVPLRNIFKTHHHHRCYRNKATLRYILASRRGTEYVDLEQGDHTVHNWVRGTCHLGMMPANGLQYATPHPCVCYMDEKLKGFNALAPEITQKQRPKSREQTALLEKGPAFGKAGGKVAGEEDWPEFRRDPIRSGSVRTRIPAGPKLHWRKRIGNKLAPPIVVDSRIFVPLVDEHQVVAINGLDGRLQWEYTTGARVDSPPVYYRGTLLFGSADGWVYCVRAGDGSLVWRFRAAPEQRLIGAFDRLESAWPVHGSILVTKGIAYFAAGRSSHLDGGIYLFGIDAVSGKLRYKKRLQGPSYDISNISQNYKLPMGALTDVMQSDGELIYMKNLVFNTKLQLQKPQRRQTSDRIHAKGGLLDDSYFKRIPWSFGPKSSYARLIVHDQTAAYFIRMFDSLRGLDPKVYFTPGKEGYLLFATDKETKKQIWKKRIPVRVNAMVAAVDLLFVAGLPDVVDPNDPLAAFEARKGGVLSACDKTDGKTLWEYKLSSPPVFNGMAAANGRLYLATQDGRIACFGK